MGKFENRRFCRSFCFLVLGPGSDNFAMLLILKVGKLLRREDFLLFLFVSSWPVHWCNASHTPSWKTVENKRFFVVLFLVLGLGQIVATLIILKVGKLLRIVKYPDLGADTFKKVR